MFIKVLFGPVNEETKMYPELQASTNCADIEIADEGYNRKANVVVYNNNYVMANSNDIDSYQGEIKQTLKSILGIEPDFAMLQTIDLKPQKITDAYKNVILFLRRRNMPLITFNEYIKLTSEQKDKFYIEMAMKKR